MDNTTLVIVAFISIVLLLIAVNIAMSFRNHANAMRRPELPTLVAEPVAEPKKRGGRPKGSKNKKKRAPNKKARRRQ